MSWPKLLILDCDGVLVDSEPLACEADAAAVQIFGTKMLSSAQAMKRFTGKSAAYMRDVLTHEFGVKDIDGCMQKKDDILWGLYREKLHTTPGLLAALHKLREAGINVLSTPLPSQILELFSATTSSALKMLLTANRRPIFTSMPQPEWALNQLKH